MAEGNGGTPKIQLVITLDPITKDLQVQGEVLQDRLLCYGMLELAREAIMNAALKPAQPLIAVPPPNLRLG